MDTARHQPRRTTFNSSHTPRQGALRGTSSNTNSPSIPLQTQENFVVGDILRHCDIHHHDDDSSSQVSDGDETRLSLDGDDAGLSPAPSTTTYTRRQHSPQLRHQNPESSYHDDFEARAALFPEPSSAIAVNHRCQSRGGVLAALWDQSPHQTQSLLLGLSDDDDNPGHIHNNELAATTATHPPRQRYSAAGAGDLRLTALQPLPPQEAVPKRPAISNAEAGDIMLGKADAGQPKPSAISSHIPLADNPKMHEKLQIRMQMQPQTQIYAGGDTIDGALDIWSDLDNLSAIPPTPKHPSHVSRATCDTPIKQISAHMSQHPLSPLSNSEVPPTQLSATPIAPGRRRNVLDPCNNPNNQDYDNNDDDLNVFADTLTPTVNRILELEPHLLSVVPEETQLSAWGTPRSPRAFTSAADAARGDNIPAISARRRVVSFQIVDGHDSDSESFTHKEDPWAAAETQLSCAISGFEHDRSTPQGVLRVRFESPRRDTSPLSPTNNDNESRSSEHTIEWGDRDVEQDGMCVADLAVALPREAEKYSDKLMGAQAFTGSQLLDAATQLSSAGWPANHAVSSLAAVSGMGAMITPISRAGVLDSSKADVRTEVDSPCAPSPTITAVAAAARRGSGEIDTLARDVVAMSIKSDDGVDSAQATRLGPVDRDEWSGLSAAPSPAAHHGDYHPIYQPWTGSAGTSQGVIGTCSHMQSVSPMSSKDSTPCSVDPTITTKSIGDSTRSDVSSHGEGLTRVGEVGHDKQRRTLGPSSPDIPSHAGIAAPTTPGESLLATSRYPLSRGLVSGAGFSDDPNSVEAAGDAEYVYDGRLASPLDSLSPVPEIERWEPEAEHGQDKADHTQNQDAAPASPSLMNGETTPRRARRRRQLFKNHASSYLDVEDIDDFFGTQEQVGPLLFPKSPSSLSSLAARPVEMSSARLKSIILTTTAAATQHRAGAPRGGDNNNSPGSTEVSQTRELQQQFGVKRNIRAHSQRDVPSTILSMQSSLSSVPASRATEADNCEENEGNEDAAVHEGLNSTTHDDSQAKVPLTKRIHHFKTKYKQTLLRPITTPAPKLNLTTSPKLSRVNRPFMVPERDGQQQHQRERQLEAESGSSTLGGSAEVGRRSLSSRHSVEMQAAGQRFFLGDRVWVRITQDAADTALLHPKENAGEGEEGYYCVGTVVDIEELRYTVECDSGITNIQVMDTTCSAHPDEPANADGRLDEPMAPFKLRRGDRVLARPPRRRRLAQATVIYPPVANGNGHAVIPKNATELAPRRPQRRAAKKGFNKEVFFVVEFDDGGLHWANTAEVRWRPAQVPATTLPPQQGGSAVNHNGKGAENKSAGRIDGSTCMGGEGDDEHRNSHGEDGRSTRLGGARKVSAQPAASSSSWVAREPPADEVEPFFAGMVFAITIAADAKPTAMGGPPSRRGRQQLMRSKALSALSSHPSAGRATVELDKERLTRWIRSRGGTVLDTFMDCLEFCRHRKLSTSPDPANRTIFMVSDAPSTTAKYLLALTCGFPVVSGTWIAECVLNNRLEDHRPFRLANGWSAEMGAMSVCTHVPRFMGGVTILVHGSSQFKLNWETILGLAGARLAKLPTATTSREWNTVSCDFVLSERKPTNSLVERVTARCARIDAESQPQWETQHVATDVDEDGNTKTSWFVSHHWAKQCIINQRIVRHNGHPSYSVYTK